MVQTISFFLGLRGGVSTLHAVLVFRCLLLILSVLCSQLESGFLSSEVTRCRLQSMLHRIHTDLNNTGECVLPIGEQINQ